MEGDPLGEAQRPGDTRGGASLGLQVAGHGEIVVLTNLEYSVLQGEGGGEMLYLEVVCVHPVDWSLPVTS